MKREADFTEKTKKTVALLSHYVCSNPNCRQDTLRVKKDNIEISQAYSIGKACHIEAASPNGPRYNPESTREKRQSLSNAIWLCSNCAEEIDRDVEAYPVARLKSWKATSEMKFSGQKQIRVFAAANPAGGVGKSSLAAYLSQALSIVSGQKVLCIGAMQGDHAGDLLNQYNLLEVIKLTHREQNSFSNALNTRKEVYPQHDKWSLDIDALSCVSHTKTKDVDYMDCENMELLKRAQQYHYGRSNLQKTIEQLCEDRAYKYVVCDCGRNDQELHKELFYMASDVLIPIGTHLWTYNGISRIAEQLRHIDRQITVWPIFTLGLRMNDKDYQREWYKRIQQAITSTERVSHITVVQPHNIIPNNRQVEMVSNIFSNAKTRNVGTAYIELATQMLKEEGYA